MKYFVEVLLENQIVQKEQLAEILLEQLMKTPTEIEIAFRNKVYSADQILNIIMYQSREGKDFRSACTALGYWTEDAHKRISSEIEKVRPKLSQMLVQKGLTTYVSLIQMLEKYLNLPAAPDELHSLSELMTEAWIQSMRQTLQAIRATTAPEELLSQFELLSVDFHKIRGMGRYSRMPLIENLAASLETVIEDTTKVLTKLDVVKRQSLAEFLDQALSIVLRLRDYKPGEDRTALDKDYVGLTSQIGMWKEMTTQEVA